jgi:hypothetical protein
MADPALTIGRAYLVDSQKPATARLVGTTADPTLGLSTYHHDGYTFHT